MLEIFSMLEANDKKIIMVIMNNNIVLLLLNAFKIITLQYIKILGMYLEHATDIIISKV